MASSSTESKVQFNETANGSKTVTTTRSGGETTGSKSEQFSKGTRATESTGTENQKSSATSSGKEDGTSKNDGVRVSESTRSLTSTSRQTSKSADRANIGASVTFTIKIRGGFPTTTGGPSC